jgi:hypothetical protein
LTHEKCAEQAAAVERVVLPEETSVFTVKPPRTLVARVPARARESGATISALVAQALTKYLAGGKSGSVRADERSGGSHRDAFNRRADRDLSKIPTALFRICPKV